MREYVKKMAAGLLAVWLVGLAASCGRSESIGWADRDQTDRASQGAATQSAASQQATEASLTGTDAELQEIVSEYRSLANTLINLQKTAMGDPELSALWAELIADADSTIIAESRFHRQLTERRAEIEARLGAQETGEEDGLSPEERAELARHHRNIQMEMARMRSRTLQRPEFAQRYLDLQAALYEKMKQLDPSRSADIDSLARLEARLYEIEEARPDVPALMTPGIQPGGGQPER